jgi:hypothetical protein
VTDNEIIKALAEHIAFSIHCDSAYSTINITLLKEALDLINRQKAEIERLHSFETYRHCRAKAVKEFAARLRYVSKWSQSDAFSDRLVTVRDINDLEKEMVGAESG